MKAVESNFLKFIQGPKQFVVPIYQRPYSWTTKQCAQLWDDIISASALESQGHFLGSIVYIQGGLYQSTAVSELQIIDGQQRLVTLSLLLKSLGNALNKSSEEATISNKKINNYYLLNNEEEDPNIRNKLLLTGADKETLINIMNDTEPTSSFGQIVQNYKFFEEMIDKNKINLNSLFEGIKKLFIVDISLERGKDNPQLIFESLNSTGLDLSQADLIRNFVLMGLEPSEQKRIYEKYWYPMQRDFVEEDYVAYFNRFMRDFLTIKLRRIPNMREVYNEFKSYILSNGKTNIEFVIKDIRHYSKLFVRLVFEKEEDRELLSMMQDINDLKIEVSYPFLMEILEDYSKNILSREDLISILRMVESYVFRRAICGIPAQSHNKTFANLTKDLDKENYLESIKAAFLLLRSYKRFPLDQEFRTQFLKVPLYNLRIAGYTLRKLENSKHTKEPISEEDYTIEHIMPQKSPLSQSWVKELGNDWEIIQQTYLHTIGNLTLTGYNSELGNLSFTEKRNKNGGFSSSPLWMNADIAKLEHWNKKEIEERANVLSESALKIWSLPDLKVSSINKYKREHEDDMLTYSEEDHYESGSDLIRSIYDVLKKQILSISPELITINPKKKYISFKRNKNFVDVVIYPNQLNLYLNLKKGTINDPRQMSKDVSKIGHWGNGQYRIVLKDFMDIEYILLLIKQSFDRN